MPSPQNIIKFRYQPRIADVGRSLFSILQELHEEDPRAFGEVSDVLALLETRDRQIEDFITPLYRASVGRRISDQTFASGSFVTVTYDTVDYDISGLMNTATGVFTCPINGFYHVYATSAALIPASVCCPLFVASIFKNGVEYVRPTSNTTAGATPANMSVTFPATDIVQANAGDTLTYQIFQNSSGGAATITHGAYSSFRVHLASPTVLS